MTISTLTPWANGIGALVATPPAGKMLSGWVGGEQPPCDWENWINKTTIDKINEMIPVVNNGIDMVNGGLYNLIGRMAWSFATYAGGSTNFIIEGNSLGDVTFEVSSYSTTAAGYFTNPVGRALVLWGDWNGLTPQRSPFQIAPLKAVPASMAGGDLCIVNGSLVFWDKTDGYAHVVHSTRVDFDSVYLSLIDMSTNETAGVRDWNFNTGGIPTFLISKVNAPKYSAYWSLVGSIHHRNMHLNSVQLRIQPGVARANVAQRMSCRIIDGISGAALSSTVYDNGTNSAQYMVLTCDFDLDFRTQSPTIEVGGGSTNGADVIWEIMINFELEAN